MARLPAIAYRSAQGIGAGAASVASAAMVAAHVGAERRGRAFALLYGSQSLALAVGPLAGGFVGASSMRVLFFGAAGLACAAATPVLLAAPGGVVDRRRPVAPRVRERRAGRVGGRYNLALLGALAIFAGTGLLGGLYESVWSLLLASRGATSVEIGLSWTMYCLPFALLERAGWATGRPPQPEGARRRRRAHLGTVRALVPGDPQRRRSRRARLSRCGRRCARHAGRTLDARGVDAGGSTWRGPGGARDVADRRHRRRGSRLWRALRRGEVPCPSPASRSLLMVLGVLAPGRLAGVCRLEPSRRRAPLEGPVL